MRTLLLVLTASFWGVICCGQTVFEFINSGVAKNDLGNYIGAISDFNKAIEINPNYAEAYYNRGVAKDYLGDYKGVFVDFNKTIEINTKYAEAYYNRGVAKYNLKDKDGACFDWRKAGDLGIKEAYEMIKKYCI